MRSPSTGMVEGFSSARLSRPSLGTSPQEVSPVEGPRMAHAFAHEPVMAAEVRALIEPVPAGVVIDATVGGGGHAAALLAAYPHLGVLGIDRDAEAVAAATEHLAPFGRRAVVVHAEFGRLGSVVETATGSGAWPTSAAPTPTISAVLLDLGVSSPQLDEVDRGFSYRLPGPLDMRMDTSKGRSASDLVNGSSAEELAGLFASSGEARYARRIAGAIVAARPVTRTDELAAVVMRAIPAAARRRGHPARRVFQALRIAVNAELEQLASVVPSALELLAPLGRAVVISYHSGEDRLVKSAFVEATTGGCHCPPRLPCVCGARPRYRLVVRGALRPTAAEVEGNRRARSARLRAVERLGEGS